jgi:hypothetical protein
VHVSHAKIDNMLSKRMGHRYIYIERERERVKARELFFSEICSCMFSLLYIKVTGTFTSILFACFMNYVFSREWAAAEILKTEMCNTKI